VKPSAVWNDSTRIYWQMGDGWRCPFTQCLGLVVSHPPLMPGLIGTSMPSGRGVRAGPGNRASFPLEHQPLDFCFGFQLAAVLLDVRQRFPDPLAVPATARGTEMAPPGGISHLHFAFCVKSAMPTSSGPFFGFFWGVQGRRSNTLGLFRHSRKRMPLLNARAVRNSGAGESFLACLCQI
jgi:hypothetical protein